MNNFCKYCGTRLMPGTKFCGTCGKAVDVDSAPAAPPWVGAAVPVRPAKRARKKGWLAAVALIAAIALGIGFLPRLLGSHDFKPVTVSRPPAPLAEQTASEAATLALQQYIYARLKTEAFFSSAQTATREELAQISEEVLLIWEEAALAASVADDISGQAVSVLEASTVRQTAAFGQPQARFMTLAAGDADASAIPLAFSGKPDPKTWAEGLTKQYDALKGAKRYQQLAQQLGTDAKTAYEQMALAQKIIHDDATAEAEYKDSLLKAAQVIKTTSKVGVFITATIVTGGGTLTALSTSGFTLAQTAGTIVGGVDCIVDVADTGSIVFLGEDNQVALTATEVKKYLGPISSVMGIVNWGDAASGEKLAYVGDTLADWFFEGKVAGVQVFTDRDGGMKLTMNVLKATGEAGLKAALKAAGYVFPDNEDIKALSDVVNGWKPDREQMIARLDALSSQMAAIYENPELYEGTDENGLETIPEDELEEWDGALEEWENEGDGNSVPGALAGWPGDFYGQSLPAPATGGHITECYDETSPYDGTSSYTIRIEGMTYQEFYAYCATLEALSGWVPYESDILSAMPKEEPTDTGYYIIYFGGAYGGLPHIALRYTGEYAAEDSGIPQFMMFVYETW